MNMKRKGLMISGLVLSLLMVAPTMESYAAEGQSARWEGTGDDWKVKTQDGSGYLVNSWFQDDVTGHWYMLGADGKMYSGLITDNSTGKSYLLNINHDGTFGRMITVDGTYNVNGRQIDLKFNQAHDGTFGAIVSGLNEVRSTGVNETKLDSIPTDDGSGSSGGGQQQQSSGSVLDRGHGVGGGDEVGIGGQGVDWSKVDTSKIQKHIDTYGNPNGTTEESSTTQSQVQNYNPQGYDKCKTDDLAPPTEAGYDSQLDDFLRSDPRYKEALDKIR